MTIKCDVLVVGGGPAGCSAAYFIKYYDTDNLIKVDLVDRLSPDKYTKYHDMCGEGISKELLDELSPLKPDGIIEKINSVIEYWPGKISIETKMDGYIIDRAIFFNSIINKFQKMGGNFKEKTVKAISQHKNKVKVQFDKNIKEYDYVIAADGPNSLIRESLGLSGRKKPFVQYIVEKEPQHGILSFYYDKKYNGDYMWEFPHENKVKIGYPLIKGKIFKPNEKILVKQSRFIGYGGLDKYTVGRILLVGDAACQTNAITKGGIRSAMVAGKIAAKSIINRNPEQYEHEWLKKEFSSNLFLDAFEKLKDMDNPELQKHMEPFRKGITFSSNIKCILFYRKYLKLYKAYDLANKVGW